MKTRLKSFVKPSQMTMLLVFLGASMISMTGCSKRYVVVDGTEKVSLMKSELDKLYTSNEQLLKALELCNKKGRQ